MPLTCSRRLPPFFLLACCGLLVSGIAVNILELVPLTVCCAPSPGAFPFFFYLIIRPWFFPPSQSSFAREQNLWVLYDLLSRFSLLDSSLEGWDSSPLRLGEYGFSPEPRLVPRSPPVSSLLPVFKPILIGLDGRPSAFHSVALHFFGRPFFSRVPYPFWLRFPLV